MTESKPHPKDQADYLVQGIERQYPRWPSTFGACPTEGCEGSGRGGGPCADCYERRLAKLVGAELARTYHDHVVAAAQVWSAICQHLEDQPDD